MIASLKGTIAYKEADSLVVELGGIGIEVFVPAALHDTAIAGETIALQTYLVVREDSLTLFGFASKEDCEYFVLLNGVSGIGPRLALAALSTLNPDAIRRAVFHEQPEVFTRVPGIGKKTAEKVVFHLKDRIAGVDELSPLTAITDTDTETLEALVALGYSVVEAQAALQSIPKDAPEDVEARLRLALQYFS